MSLDERAVAIPEKHYHNGGGAEPRRSWDQPTVARCTCGQYVKYVFRGDEHMGGWYWVRLNPWDKWKWRHELRAHKQGAGAA
jgi:hypothetical protein